MIADLPAWAALPAAALLLAGAALTLAGSVGLVRLGSFYERVHAPTLGATLGLACVAGASMLAFSAAAGRPVLGELLVVALMSLTTPVTLMLLARAALYRDRAQGGEEVPPARLPDAPEGEGAPPGRGA